MQYIRNLFLVLIMNVSIFACGNIADYVLEDERKISNLITFDLQIFYETSAYLHLLAPISNLINQVLMVANLQGIFPFEEVQSTSNVDACFDEKRVSLGKRNLGVLDFSNPIDFSEKAMCAVKKDKDNADTVCKNCPFPLLIRVPSENWGVFGDFSPGGTFHKTPERH